MLTLYIFNRLRNEGKPWNHKKVYRVYKAMHYEKRVQLKRRIPQRVQNPLVKAETSNETWSIDFVTDALECGRKFRVLDVIDDGDRYAIGQEVAMSMLAKRVIRMLEEMIWNEGKPKNIRCDNGPEFISKDFRSWCNANEINIIYIQPGRPMQNSYIERFNGSYRRAVLDMYIFRNLAEVKEKTAEWRKYYNEERPHEALENNTPAQSRKLLLNEN